MKKEKTQISEEIPDNLSEKYMLRFSSKINKLFDMRNWNKAIDLLQNEVRKYPNEYFLYSTLSKAYYNVSKFDEALNYSKKAMSIEQNDPLVIYDYACAQYKMNNFSIALTEWEKIVHLGVARLRRKVYCDNLKWAKSIVNDSRARMALCYMQLEDFKKAKKLLSTHLSARVRGIYSDFSKKEITNFLNETSLRLNQ